MSKKNKEIGECCICGNKGELSFEHVPPEAAFNKQTVIHAKDYYSASNKRAYLANPNGPQSQRGIGGYSLCIECNPKTGGWYGRAYVELAKLVNDKLEKNSSSPINISAKIYPLRILKQVITCFFSVNGPLSNYTKSSDLADFVLDKDLQNISLDKMRIYMFATRSGRSRANSFMYKDIVGSDRQSYFSEYVSAPLGFILTLNYLSPLEEDLYDITHFSKFGYSEKTKLDMTLTVKEIYSAFGGDYRTKQELERNFAKGELSEKSFRIQKEKEDYRHSTTPKKSPMTIHIPYVGPSGPISGLYDNKTSRGKARDAKQRGFSHQYDYILFMGTTTVVIDGHVFSVSHVRNLRKNAHHLPLNFLSRGLEANPARGYALTCLIDKLNRNHEAIENVSVCIITNFDDEYIEEIASQRIPLYKDFYLPQNFKIINHLSEVVCIDDEALGYVLEESLEECVEQSKDILNLFERKVGFPKSYHPETGEIKEMMQAEDVPLFRSKNNED